MPTSVRLRPSPRTSHHKEPPYMMGWGVERARDGNRSPDSCHPVEETLPFEEGEHWTEPGTEVLFTRLTAFLTVFKNSKCKTSVIKSWKIAYISGFTKKGKNLARFTSFQ